MKRLFFGSVVWLNHKLKRLSMKLVKITGKHPDAVHPKHLLGEDPDQYWYMAHLAQEDTVLDVGCGTGLHAVRAARRVRSVVGFDLNVESLEIGLRAARAECLDNIRFERGSAEETFPFQDGAFSKVLMLDILEHLHARDMALREARRVLRVGGELIIAVPNRMTSWRLRLKRAGLFSYYDPDHKYEYTREEVFDVLKRHGFEVLKESPVVVDTPWIGLFDCLGGLSLSLYRRLHRWKREFALRHPNESTGFQVVAVRL